jgi:hypothetical protein
MHLHLSLARPSWALGSALLWGAIEVVALLRSRWADRVRTRARLF